MFSDLAIAFTELVSYLTLKFLTAATAMTSTTSATSQNFYAVSSAVLLMDYLRSMHCIQHQCTIALLHATPVHYCSVAVLYMDD